MSPPRHPAGPAHEHEGLPAQLRWRLPVSPPPDAAGLLVPWWIAPLFILLGLALTPWIVWLMFTLPSQHVAAHWQIAWAGFDVGLAVLLSATGVMLARRSPAAEPLAAMTAAFLICDAWFDTTTSRGSTTLAIALAEAFGAELPLAGLCLWIAHNFERVVADARPLLVRAGFRVEHGHLVPPDGEPEP